MSLNDVTRGSAPDASTIFDFLSQVLHGAPPDHQFLIWTLSDKRSRWTRCDEIEEAARLALELATDTDVYFGVAARPPGFTPSTQRGGAADVAAVLGLWADIDVLSDAHKNPTLPPTLSDAIGLLDAFGLPPTMIVATGHGAHAYWLFKEWYVLDSPEDRALVADACRRLQKILGDAAGARGWSFDATWNLDRVLRVAGCANRKLADRPMRVEVMHATEDRYELTTLVQALDRHIPPLKNFEVETGSRPTRSLPLSPYLADVLRMGSAGDLAGRYDGDRSRIVHAIVASAKRRGASFEEVMEALRDPGNLGGERFREEEAHGRGRDWLERSWEKVAARGTSGLPQVEVSATDLAATGEETIALLAEANLPPELFVRHGSLVRLCRDEHGVVRPDQVLHDAMRAHLARTIEFGYYTKSDDGTSIWQRMKPPPEIVKYVLASPEFDGFPPLAGIVTAPVLRPDWSLVRDPGYDDPTGLWHEPSAGLTVDVPQEPSVDDISAAVSILHDLLQDFPFDSPSSFANAIALMLTPLIQDALGSPVPLALVSAPMQGSGKTLLAEVVGTVTSGSPPYTVSPTNDADEMRKRLTTALMQDVRVLLFDNIVEEFDSPQLSVAITTGRWNDRILGKNKDVNIAPRCVWIASGNNMMVTGDLRRRCYLIRLDPQTDRPNERSYAHEDLLGWARQNRGRLLAALLTMVRGWASAGCPSGPVRRFNTFDNWARAVAGVLNHVGIPGFLDNLDEVTHAAGGSESLWLSALMFLRDRHGDGPFTARDALMDLIAADAGRLPHEVARLTADGPGPNSVRRLGLAFLSKLGTRFGSDQLRLEREEDRHTKQAVWRVVVG